MSNFPVYQYQPQAGFGQQMQPYCHAQQPQQPQERPILFRLVTSREEVRGFPVDFSGQPMGFMTPNQQTLWIKVFNSNTGSADLFEYRRGEMEQTETAFATKADVEQLLEIVRRQGEEIERMKAPRRRMNKEQEAADDEV